MMIFKDLLASTSITLFFVTASFAQESGPGGLTVDLDYGLYTGIYNETTKLNVWRGIRYGVAGRWQSPQVPPANRTPVIASMLGPNCPQSFSQTGTTNFVPGNEDCLYLSVFTPSLLASPPGTGENSAGNGKDAPCNDNQTYHDSSDRQTSGHPVLVWIHGGGYGLGYGAQDMSSFINANENGLIAVVIQYRLGALGFLSSPEVKAKGVLNAGLLDQKFALEWVQKHIAKFGGDPERVTISGESAGAGSVLLHAIAQNGTLGTKLFKNIFTASAWVPTQPYHDDPIPVQHYNDFAKTAGCTATSNSTSVFECLVAKDSLSLQYAGNRVSTSPPTPRGEWAFIPVTDGTYITGPPSLVLSQRRVNGLRALLGVNANEGALIIPHTIKTQSDLTIWLKEYFVNLSEQNMTSLLDAYPSNSDAGSSAQLRFETDGQGSANAINVSQAATGHQQRAYNIGAEASVICQSYWLASAFSTAGHSSWHYQYSVPFAVHGSDIAGYWGPPTPNQSPDFVKAFQRIVGNFVTKNNPSLSADIAHGESVSPRNMPHPASNWPVWTERDPRMINLNETGGTPYKTIAPNGNIITQYADPGLRNNITLVNAFTWEGGRGKRCEFWKVMSPLVPQ